MKKLSDWVQRFETVVEKKKNLHFDWGTHNCVTFASDLFEATTGKKVQADIKLAPNSTERQAYVVLKKFAGGGIDNALEKTAKEFGLEEIPPLMAQRGDLLIVEFDGTRCAATVNLTGRSAIAVTPDKGLADIPMKFAVRAWRIS